MKEEYSMVYKPENSTHEKLPIRMAVLSQEEWESNIKTHMQEHGWSLDLDDEKAFQFSFIEGEFHWMRDYDKKTRRFVQFNGNQKINLKSI